MKRHDLIRVLAIAMTLAAPLPALAGDDPVASTVCRREGAAVLCVDGRRGILAGDSIIWSDGTRSSAATQHPSVIIGNKASVHVGPGVFVGKGSGMVPLDDPNAPNKRRCALLDGVSYCE
jgi:hypothetical protein